MKREKLIYAAYFIILALLLRAASPVLSERLSRAFDPERRCAEAVAAMGESLSQKGLHKSIITAFEYFEDVDVIPVIGRNN